MKIKRKEKKNENELIWAWMKQGFKRKMGVSYWAYFELGLGLSGLFKRKRNGLEWAVW